MISLKNVTLLIFAPDNSQKRADAAGILSCYLSNNINFGAIKVLTSLEPKIIIGKWDKVEVMNYDEANYYQALCLSKHVKTEYVMHCETDGFPINFNLWDDKYLQFDYIGAPWPINFKGVEKNRVGNGGFSIRSARLLKLLEKKYKFYWRTDRFSDQFICQDLYPLLVNDGISFADVETALRFSFENPLSDYPNWNPTMSFGFHGKFGYFKQYLDKINNG